MPHRPVKEIVGGLTKLDWVDKIAADLELGQVRLSENASWDSGEQYTFTINNYGQYDRQTLPSPISGEPTWVAFKLPVGVVVTLIEREGDGNLADLKNCGKCIDLVGTGEMETTDLGWYNMNDSSHGFFWRRVDLKLGAVELYEDSDYESVKNTIFLSEWEVNKRISMAGWYLNDKISSARWKLLKDRQQFVLFDNLEGDSGQYNAMSAWNTEREIASLGRVAMNDRASSFLWKGAIPVYEEVPPFDLKVHEGNRTQVGVFATQILTNNTSLPQKQTISLKGSETQTLTTTTEDTYATGISSTVTSKLTTEMTAPGVGKIANELTFSVTIKFDYTHKEGITRTSSNSTEVTVSQEVTVNKWSKVEAQLKASIAKLPAERYTVDVDRWYAEPVTGSVKDETKDRKNPNLWKRTEQTTISVEGSMAVSTWVDLQQLEGPEKDSA